MVEIGKTIGKTIDTNDTHVKKTIEKPSTTMVLWQKPLTIPSWSKSYHRSGLSPIIFDVQFIRALPK